MKREIRESSVIVNWMINRIQKGLGINAIVVGPPGMGKSYLCLRIMELIYRKMHDEKLVDAKHIVDDIPSAFGFVKSVKRPGEPLTIEEVSVLASARRSMASDNVSLNYLLDTCRKKQVILLMNAPHIKSVDSHIQRMSHIIIECLRVNKRKEITTVKALKLQTNQSSGKVYQHRFHHNGKEVHRSYFFKPNEELCKTYEKQKDKFMKDLYDIMQFKGEKKKNENLKAMGKRPKKKTVTLPTETELRRYTMFAKDGMSVREIAIKEGCSPTAVHYTLKKLENKTRLDLNIQKNREDAKKNGESQLNDALSSQPT